MGVWKETCAGNIARLRRYTCTHSRVSIEMDAVPRTNGLRSPIVAAVASAKRSLIRFLRSDAKAYA